MAQQQRHYRDRRDRVRDVKVAEQPERPHQRHDHHRERNERVRGATEGQEQDQHHEQYRQHEEQDGLVLDVPVEVARQRRVAGEVYLQARDAGQLLLEHLLEAVRERDLLSVRQVRVSLQQQQRRAVVGGEELLLAHHRRLNARVREVVLEHRLLEVLPGLGLDEVRSDLAQLDVEAALRDALLDVGDERREVVLDDGHRRLEDLRNASAFLPRLLHDLAAAESGVRVDVVLEADQEPDHPVVGHVRAAQQHLLVRDAVEVAGKVVERFDAGELLREEALVGEDALQREQAEAEHDRYYE